MAKKKAAVKKAAKKPTPQDRAQNRIAKIIELGTPGETPDGQRLVDDHVMQRHERLGVKVTLPSGSVVPPKTFVKVMITEAGEYWFCRSTPQHSFIGVCPFDELVGAYGQEPIVKEMQKQVKAHKAKASKPKAVAKPKAKPIEEPDDEHISRPRVTGIWKRKGHRPKQVWCPHWHTSISGAETCMRKLLKEEAGTAPRTMYVWGYVKGAKEKVGDIVDIHVEGGY